MFIYFERERKRVHALGAEKEGESQAGSTLSVWLELTDHEIMNRAETKNQPFN